jgi:hypothetical protein
MRQLPSKQLLQMPLLLWPILQMLSEAQNGVNTTVNEAELFLQLVGATAYTFTKHTPTSKALLPQAAEVLLIDVLSKVCRSRATG